MKKFLIILFAIICGISVYFLIAPLAYAERGYQAYGGEVLLAIAIIFLVIYIGFFIIRAKQKKKAMKK